MKTLFLDPFSGVSGDMFLGALIDLGVDAAFLERELHSLPVGGYHLHVSRQQKSQIQGVKFDVHLESDHQHNHTHAHSHESHPAPGHHHGHPHGHEQAHAQDHGHQHHGSDAQDHDRSHAGQRSFREITQLIESSPLKPWVREKSIAVFQRIAEAEGRIHGVPAEHVHFHEVGALDSIIDVVGAAIALDALGRPRVESGPVIDGQGFVRCAHGRYPVPAPATLAILGARGIEITQCDEPHELVTPTGAALIAEFAERIGPMRNLVPEKVGYGLGARDHQSRPNVLRAILGSARLASTAGDHDWETDVVAVIETNLDDATPELLGHCLQKALAQGALDAFHTAVHMKKNRPGVQLTILCAEADADRFAELVLRETTAFGVRCYRAERRKLRRESARVETPLGSIAVKLGRLDGRVLHATPEYESCRAAAESQQRPLREVYAAAEAVARKQFLSI